MLAWFKQNVEHMKRVSHLPQEGKFCHKSDPISQGMIRLRNSLWNLYRLVSNIHPTACSR